MKICENWIFYLSTVAANIIFIAYGTTVGWNSPVLSKLQSNDTIINPLDTPITVIQLSIATSIFPVGSLIGTILVTKLPDIYGRRQTVIYLAIIGMFSFIILYFVRFFWMYVIFLGIVSITMAAGITVVPTYLSEVTEIQNRGKFGSAVALGKTIGQFYAYLLGPITSFPVFSLCCGLPLLLHLLLSVFTQESPIYFILKGDENSALNSLKKLRKNKRCDEIEYEIREKKEMLQYTEQRSSFKILLKTRTGRKAFLLCIVVRLLPVMSGLYIVTSFLGPLLKDVDSQISGDTLAVIIAVVKMIAATTCISIIEKLGRKLLILVASFTCGATMFGLGIYFYFKEHLNYVPQSLKLLAIICVVFFVIAYNLGLGGVPYIVISELLSNEVRASGTSIVFFLCNIFLVLQSFGYPLVANYFGTYYCMFTFSLCCFCGFIFVYFLLPETKGKSFSQIQEILKT